MDWRTVWRMARVAAVTAPAMINTVYSARRRERDDSNMQTYTRGTEGPHHNMSELALVGASLLAMDLRSLRGVRRYALSLATIASGLAPTGGDASGNKKGDRGSPVAFFGSVEALTALLPPCFN